MVFLTHIFGGGADVQQARQYDVTADGRFLTRLRSSPPGSLAVNLGVALAVQSLKFDVALKAVAINGTPPA